MSFYVKHRKNGYANFISMIQTYTFYIMYITMKNCRMLINNEMFVIKVCK